MSRKIGIICAGDREFEPFIKHIDNVRITEQAMLKVHEGTINKVDVVRCTVVYVKLMQQLQHKF